VALKEKRDLPDILNRKHSPSPSSSRGKRKSSTTTRVKSTSSSGSVAKRGRPASRLKSHLPLVEKNSQGREHQPLVESSFENRWELVQMGPRFLTIPKPPSLSNTVGFVRLKTYSKNILKQHKQQLTEMPSIASTFSVTGPIDHSNPVVGKWRYPIDFTVIDFLIPFWIFCVVFMILVYSSIPKSDPNLYPGTLTRKITGV